MPETRETIVQPGRLHEAKFVIRSRAAVPVTGQAVPSVAPSYTAKYLQKTECFCFTPQHFAPARAARVHRALHRRPGPAAAGRPDDARLFDVHAARAASSRRDELIRGSAVAAAGDCSRTAEERPAAMAQAHAAHGTDKYYIPHGSKWPAIGAAALFITMLGTAAVLNGCERRARGSPTSASPPWPTCSSAGSARSSTRARAASTTPASTARSAWA